jgi:Ras-related protein Rab-2A
LGALVVYDLTRRESFHAVYKFIQNLRELAEPDCQITLVGNKYDLIQDNPEKRQISLEEIKQIKKEYNLNYIETSASANIRVDEAFENLLEGKFFNL